MPEVPSGTVAAPPGQATGPGASRISLPKPLTSFIGRERELAQAKRLLQCSYLVTLTGPGGSGKTRLCIALAAEVADAYRDANEFPMPVPIAEIVDRWLAPARAKAGRSAGRLLAEGRRLSPEEAVGLALANEPDDAPPPGRRQTLTRREAEVAVLAARGLTNRDIAAQLFLSVRTVEVHVDRILTKLGFHTRTQLAA
jgi:DNA-binding CsgD family transcriptional regulator